MMKLFFLAAVFPFFLTLHAQVQVSKEPLHHKLLDNAHVRLLDVHIPPGDTTLIHIHSTPSVFLVLSNAKTGSQVIQEEDHSKSPIPHFGNMVFEGFYITPRIHRVWNSDTMEFHVIDLELPNKNFITIEAPINKEGFNFLFEEKPVRAYRFNSGLQGEISIKPRKADILVILTSDPPSGTKVNAKSFNRKGDFIYIPAGEKIEIKNGGPDNSVFAFFELK